MEIIYPKNFSKSRNEIILKYCKWKKILHIGACDSPYTEQKYNWKLWPLLYREVDKVCESQIWIDLDKEKIDFLNSKKSEFKNSKVQFYDMNNLEDFYYKPDVIIFWEVIEHLMNLEIALTNLKKIMGKNTILIITTPNAYYYWSIRNIIFRKELMHEDHKVYFSYWYLKNLLYFNWIEIEKWYFTFLDRYSGGRKGYIFKILRSIYKLFSILISTIILKISIWFSENITLITKLKWK
jgi:hypothetical protein